MVPVVMASMSSFSLGGCMKAAETMVDDNGARPAEHLSMSSSMHHRQF